MDELNYNEDLFVPAFLLKLPHQSEIRGNHTQADDFLENVQAWTGFAQLEECEE